MPAPAEVFVSVKNGITKAPYVTSDGQVSLNIPIEDAEWSDVMFEAKVSDIANGRITLPSLIAFPGLRPLLQKIQEGDRVELFHFQPDAGDPVMAGFIPPNGIEEQDGKVILNFDDTLGQLRWQHLKRFEYLSAPASGLYDRARSTWQDLINEDFTLSTWPSDYTITVSGAATAVNGGGFWKVSGPDATGAGTYLQGLIAGGGLTLQPGAMYVLEADVTISTTFGASSSTRASLLFASQVTTPGTIASVRVGSTVGYSIGSGSFPQIRQNYGTFVGLTDPANVSLYTFIDNVNVDFITMASQSGTNAGTAQTTWPMPVTHHLVAFLSVGPNYSQPGLAKLFPTVRMVVNNAGDSVQVANLRVSQLTPVLNRAARFNPQTTDAVTYQPNFEDNLQFLQLVAEKDGSEYRPIYHAWPQLDELEVDLAGTLGRLSSRQLGYEQPPKLPTEGSPQASPAPVIQDVGTMLTAPLFRLEEGYNLAAAPRIQPRANAHANDVIRVGASTMDAQTFAEKWSMAELGRPQHSPSGALYPRFEQITNDDRVGLQSLVSSFASFELARRIDSTPSLELHYVEELPWAFRWRAGDFPYVITRSLRTNLEQEMRATRIAYKAGAPERTIIVGKGDWDPTMLRMLGEDTKISWLYDQSGTNPGIYVYPSVGNISSGATSPVFSIPLDQYTVASALVYAALHWFADANVSNVQPQINGQPVDTSTLPAGTDSGLVLVTGYFQKIGTYQLAFKNNDASTRNLTGAFLVLRIKG